MNWSDQWQGIAAIVAMVGVLCTGLIWVVRNLWALATRIDDALDQVKDLTAEVAALKTKVGL